MGLLIINFDQLTDVWVSTGVNENLFKNGDRMNFIPFYPLNGSVDPKLLLQKRMVTSQGRSVNLC